MRENNFYHGPIFPETRQFVRDQFHVGDTVEISDLGSDGHTLKGFKKLKFWKNTDIFLQQSQRIQRRQASTSASAIPIPISRQLCMFAHAWRFEIIYVNKFCFTVFLQNFMFTSALYGVTSYRVIRRSCHRHVDFFHINLLSFIIERLPIESSALSRRVIRRM